MTFSPLAAALALCASLLGACLGAPNEPGLFFSTDFSLATSEQLEANGIWSDPPSSPAVIPHRWDHVEYAQNRDSPYNHRVLSWEPKDAAQLTGRIEADPDDASNTAVRFRAATLPLGWTVPLGKSYVRLQHGFQKRTGQATKHFSFVQRVRLGAGFRLLDDAYTSGHYVYWLTLGEFWGAYTSQPLSHRITFQLVNNRGGGPLFWRMSEEDQDDATNEYSTQFERGHFGDVGQPPVVFEEWFTVGIEIKEGDDTTGYCKVQFIIGGVLYTLMDETIRTQNRLQMVGDGFEEIQVQKLYSGKTSTLDYLGTTGGGELLDVWFDDFELYNGPMPDLAARATATAPTVLHVAPAVDTYVSRETGFRDSSFGTEQRLIIRREGNSAEKSIFLKFVVSGTNGQGVAKALVWIAPFLSASAVDSGELFHISNTTWDASLTYNQVQSALASYTGVRVGGWSYSAGVYAPNPEELRPSQSIFFDVSSVITGDGVYAFRFAKAAAAGGSTELNFLSSRANCAMPNMPQPCPFESYRAFPHPRLDVEISPATTRTPTTRAPTTRAPTSRAPSTGSPTARVPTSRAPTSRAPTSRAPTSRAPTSRAPSTSSLTTGTPTTHTPTAADATASPTAAPTASPSQDLSNTTTTTTTMSSSTGFPTVVAPTLFPTSAPTPAFSSGDALSASFSGVLASVLLFLAQAR